MRFSLPHRRRRVFSFFDVRSSFSRFSDFIEKVKQIWNLWKLFNIIQYYSNSIVSLFVTLPHPLSRTLRALEVMPPSRRSDSARWISRSRSASWTSSPQPKRRAAAFPRTLVRAFKILGTFSAFRLSEFSKFPIWNARTAGSQRPENDPLYYLESVFGELLFRADTWTFSSFFWKTERHSFVHTIMSNLVKILGLAKS